METPNYSRLREVAHLRYMDSDNEVLKSGQASLADSRESLLGISERLPELMTGEALSSAQARLDYFTEELAAKERLIEAYMKHHEAARASMRKAVAAFHELPTVLVDHGTEQMVRAEERLFIDGSYVTPHAYIQALRVQANAEREAQAAAALAAMNGEVSQHREALAKEAGEIRILPDQADPSSSSQPEIGTSAGAAAIGAAGAALAGNRFSAGGNRPASIVGNAPTATAGGTGIITRPGVYRRPPASGPGSRMEPINDPDALRHLDLYKTPINPRMSPDGPIGGYLPAAVTDGADPRWSSEAARAAANSSRATLSAGMLLSGGAGLAGGAFGRGTAAQETRAMGAGGILGGVGAAGTRAVMGASTSSPALAGGIPTSGLPAGGLAATSGAQGAGAAGMNAAAANSTAASSMNGLARATTPGPMTPGAGTPTATPGAPGLPGAFTPGATGANSERKSGKDRIGYQVVRIRDDERRPIKLSEGAGAGTSADVKPIVIDDTDDSWE